jgi:hypothetical protein
MQSKITVQLAPLTQPALETPQVCNAMDAEVDIEVLKAVPKAFEINSEDTANWLVKKVIAARQYAERVTKWAEQEQRRAEREESTLMFLFGRQIEKWTRDEIEKFQGRRKSISLPAGMLAIRHVNAKIIIDDEAAVIEWAKGNVPAAVKVTEHLLKSEIDAHCKQSGELPPRGIHVEPEREQFSIR